MRIRTVAALWILAGCAPGTRPILEYGSGADIDAILSANGASAITFGCRNPAYARDPKGGGIRTVTCLLRISAADLATLTANLPLTPGETMLPATTYVGSCADLMKAEGQLQVLVGSNTKVTNGVGRVEVHVQREGKAACMEVTYPWS